MELLLIRETSSWLVIASQTPSVAATIKSQLELSLKVAIWGMAEMTCFQAGLFSSLFRRKSPKLRVGMRTPPTLLKVQIIKVDFD